jgi:hypothetical protein
MESHEQFRTSVKLFYKNITSLELAAFPTAVTILHFIPENGASVVPAPQFRASVVLLCLTAGKKKKKKKLTLWPLFMAQCSHQVS